METNDTITILAFLQNQWVHNPERTLQRIQQAETVNGPRGRAFVIRYMLFAGCKTGQRLQDAFGEDVCDQIIWENASPKIGGKSSAVFPPDTDHMVRTINNWSPHIILAFGNVAISGMNQIDWTGHRINCPHPTSRGADCTTILRRKAHEVRDTTAKLVDSPR